MVRIALTFYLVLMALLGPGLCCCTNVRLLAGPLGRRGSILEERNHNTAPYSACGCDHHQSSRRPMPPPSGPLGDSPSCPCEDHKIIPVAALATDAPLNDHLRSSLLQPAPNMVVSAQHPGLPPAIDQFRGFQDISMAAFRTGREILRALQTLRC